MPVADITNEVILGTDIMNVYRSVVDLRENVLRVAKEKNLILVILFCISFAWLNDKESTNHSIKEVTVGEEEVDRSGQEEPSLLYEETEEGLVGEVLTCMATEEGIGKTPMVIEERLLPVPELKEASGGEVGLSLIHI